MTATHAAAAEVRRAYVDQAAVSYSFYVVGASAAFIAVALSLSDTQAGLHSSAMAVGMIVAGIAGERFDRLAGVRRVHLAGMSLLAVIRGLVGYKVGYKEWFWRTAEPRPLFVGGPGRRERTPSISFG